MSRSRRPSTRRNPVPDVHPPASQEFVGMWRAATQALDAETVMQAVNLLPTPPRRFILKSIGVRTTDKASPSMAAQILARLRSKPGVLDEFAHAVLMPAMAMAAQPLSMFEWIDLAGPKPQAAARVYVNNSELVSCVHLLWRVPRTFARLALVAAAQSAGNGPTIALNLLADFDEDAVELYNDPAESVDGRPPLIGLDVFSPVGRLRALTGQDVDEGIALPDLLTGLRLELPEEDTGVLDEVDVEEVDPREVSKLLAGAARDWADRLDEGVLASPLVTGPIHRLASRIWKYAGELGVGDLDGLLRARERARNPQVDPTRWWLVRLAKMQGPAEVAGLSGVTQLAAEASLVDEHDAEEALAALMLVVDLVADQRAGRAVDVQALLTANGVALAGLREYSDVVSAASMGMLTLPLAEDVTPADSDTPETRREEAEDDCDAEDDVAVQTPSAVGEPAAQAEGPAVEPTPADDAAEEPATVSPATTEVNADGVSVATAEEDARDEELQAEPIEDVAPAVPAPEMPSPSPGPVMVKTGLSPDLAKYLTKAAPAPKPEPVPVAATILAMEPADTVAAEAPTDVDDRTVWGTAAACQLQAALIGAGRFALAADLAQATGANTAQVAARHMAAYAAVLSDPTGPIATEISQLVAVINREQLGDDRLGQLAAWAGAAKVALLAPSAGPAEVLVELTPAVSSSSALTEVTAALIDAARQGVVVVAPEAMAAAGATAEVTARVAGLTQRAGELMERAKTRTMKYLPAGDVYNAWLAPGGALYEALDAVRTDKRSAAPRVRKQIVDRLRGAAERQIDSVFSAQNRHKGRGVKIVAQPRGALVARWDEAVDLAARWAAAVDELAALTNAASSGSWQEGALARLRVRIAPHRARAASDLARLCADAGLEPQGQTGPVALLTQTFLASDGSVPTSDEPSPAYARHAELLATDLALDPRTLLPSEPVPAQTLVGLAVAPAVDDQAVYQSLAARGAHDLTEVLVAAANAKDEAAGATLTVARQRDIYAQEAQMLDDLNALEGDVDVRRVQGVLGDDLWTRAASVVEALKAPGRTDYERIRARAVELVTQMDSERAEAIADTVERIESLAQDDPNVAVHAERLTSLASDGQVASAQEQLQQLREGQTLSGEDVRVDLLSGFFPKVPQVMARGAASERLQMLNRALRDGIDNDASTELSTADLDLLGLPASRAKQAREAFTAWVELSSASPQRSGTSEADKLKAILRQAGIEFVGRQVAQGGSRERQMVTLTDVSVLGKALTPVLGSGKSADGTSLKVLLVRRAATPASIIESLWNLPADATILLLWLGRSPLTPAEWRAVGEAARGRVSAPPIVVMDLSVLVYLAAQAEPRISTLAAVTLPFTASNPYRDTPGDTAPEMFYGRTDERAALIDMAGSSFVSGGRQLGKSALLRQAKREFEAASPQQVAIVETIYSVRSGSDPANVWPLVWRVLRDRDIVSGHVPEGDVAAAVYDAVRDWLRGDPERRLLLMLDEADEFLDADATGNRFENVEWFRKLMLDTNRAFKVVLAGLHATARFESLPNQPLSHLGRPIVVGPLRPAHARALLTGPLAAVGYRFDSEVTVASVLSQANNMPAQLQLIGQALVEHMASKAIAADAPPSQITAADVAEAFTPKLKDALRAKFLLTLALDPRYKVIAYVVASEAHERGSDASLTLGELMATCRSVWPAGFDGLGADAVRGLVAECVDLGVLARDENHYRLRTPSVRRLLGTALEVLEVLDAADKLEVPNAYDGSVFRRQVDCLEKAVSPLTERQLTEVFTRGPRVVVVAGAPATGLNAVARTLEEVAPVVRHAGVVKVVSNARADGVTSAVGKATDNTRLLVDVRNAGHDHVAGILTAAQASLTGLKRDVSVIVVAGPASASAWVGHPNLVELGRVDDAGMRLLAGAEAVMVHEPVNQERAVAELGGWLTAIAELRRALTAPGPQLSEGEVIAQVAAHRASKPGTLAEEAGVKPVTGTALARALGAVHDLTRNRRETRSDIVGLLDELGDASLIAAAFRDGFTSLEQVFDALVALRVVTRDAEGLWGVEPVLAADLVALAAGTQVA
ncbi:hypothetical protein ACFWH7_14185 [Cellulosimicrobium cellulans]|uniref:hypothetical protein n=1 Tax=Cellulosimicrobium cellulans TaxID=1710 RepID=UPI003667E0B7